jgi:hypothetical protein
VELSKLSQVPGEWLVPLRIGLSETALQEDVMALGGRWDRNQQLWIVPNGCIAGTKLEKFIIVETPKGDIK